MCESGVGWMLIVSLLGFFGNPDISSFGHFRVEILSVSDTHKHTLAYTYTDTDTDRLKAPS